MGEAQGGKALKDSEAEERAAEFYSTEKVKREYERERERDKNIVVGSLNSKGFCQERGVHALISTCKISFDSLDMMGSTTLFNVHLPCKYQV